MSKETKPNTETPTTKFTSQVEQSFDELLGSASWNVGMPFETPLRWHLTQYSHEDSPRDIGLWIKLDENTIIYLTKILKQVSPDDGIWKIRAEEQGSDGISTVTSATILESGRVNKIQIKRQPAENDSGEMLVDSQWDYTKHQKAKILPHLTSLLEEASDIVPSRQEKFMQGLEYHELSLAHTLQILGTVSVEKTVAVKNR